MFQCRRPSRSGPARSTDRWPRYRPSRRTPSPGPLADRPSPQPASLAGPATSASGQWPAPNGRASARRLRRWCRLVGDVDDAFHAEFGVLAVVLGVKEAGQHPEAGPDVDDLLLRGAVGQDVDEGGEAGGQALRLAVLALLQQLGDLLRARQAGPPRRHHHVDQEAVVAEADQAPVAQGARPRKLNSIEDIAAFGAGNLAGEAALVI